MAARLQRATTETSVAPATDTSPTARNRFRSAVWKSPLPPLQKLVALAYADHASRGTMAVFVAPELLAGMTGLGRTALRAARRGLVDAGWLTLVSPGYQHHAARYALAIPDSARGSRDDPLGTTPEGRETAPEGRETAPEGRETAPNQGTNPGTNPSARTSASNAPPARGRDAQRDDDDLSDEARGALRTVGLSDASIATAWALALSDTETKNPNARIARDTRYAAELADRVRRERDIARSKAGKCAVHRVGLSGDDGYCMSCAGDHLTGEHQDDVASTCLRCAAESESRRTA